MEISIVVAKGDRFKMKRPNGQDLTQLNQTVGAVEFLVMSVIG